MAQITFLTLFLGLVNGRQAVALQVSGPVKSVRLLIDGRAIGTMHGPPWRALADLGAGLAPRELAAVGLNENGVEIARATQTLNLPRPTAELSIVIDRDDASLRWRHLVNVGPARAKMTLDGKPLRFYNGYHAHLPKLNLEVPHVIAAEMVFKDGLVVRREHVIESIRSDSVESELTPVLLRETSPAHPPTWSNCLTRDGKPVRTASVERGRGLLTVVRDPDDADIQAVLDPSLRRRDALRSALQLGHDDYERIIWPIADRFPGDDGVTSVLFRPSEDMNGEKVGVLNLLLQHYPGETTDAMRRQFSDAVAVAGVRAVTGAQRRAVVLILGRSEDKSRHDPATVRAYLRAVGVPLFVWSMNGPRSDVAATWGAVEDVSSIEKLTDAVKRVRAALEEQRIAWVAVDPLGALRLKADERCGIATLNGTG